MLEHSGTYRENAAHTGTFAQEIITLVHFVKEQYFRGDGVTLTERFSAPQKGGYAEDELEELTLHQRFSSNRSGHVTSHFQELLSKQPQRGPGDLRHDLERRRQEKLEAVKVTIEGSSFSQRSQHSQWSVHTGKLRCSQEVEIHQHGCVVLQGSRRGAFHRPNMATQRRNNQLGNQRQNLHSNPAGNAQLPGPP
uniref:Uncharacterized protein n=1 Tax=Xiphophorus couchianus TaxID=32473 RepID=A0A3B5MI76_9TELE